MEIRLSNISTKFLEKLEVQKTAKQIALKIKKLGAQGHFNDSKALKSALCGYYRVDVGEYRIIYKISDKELLIPIIGKRNDGEVDKMRERLKK